MFQGEERKTLTAHFPRTVSIYEGSDVRVLGVPIGTVDTVTPSGTDVVVTMSYDAETEVPATPRPSSSRRRSSATGSSSSRRSYEEGEVLADGATLTEDQTAVPLELDQIYSSMDQLTVALGPTGANRNGALSDLLETTADELRRPGRAVPPDDPGLQQVHPDPRPQQGGAVRLRPRAGGLHQHPRRERPDRASVQPVAGRRRHDARGGARRAEGVAEQPRRGDG